MAASSSRHPLGFNARDDFDPHLMHRRAQVVGGMRAFVAQVSADQLHKLTALRDVTDVLIWRTHHDDALAATALNPEAWVDARLAELKAQGLGPGDVWLHLHNEAGVTETVVAWEARAIRHGVARGARFVALNPSVGVPEAAGVALARPVLDLAQQHPEHVLVGLHEYFYVRHNAYNEAIMWHVGRVKNWLAYCHDNGLDRVRFCVTECGPDELNDVKDREPERWPRTTAPDGVRWNELRGYRTLEQAYRKDFGAEFDVLGLGGLVCRECAYAWEKAWEGRVEFALWFSLGEAYSSGNGWHGSQPWKQFNVEKDEDFWLYWTEWGRALLVDVNPGVDDARWVVRRALAAGHLDSNVRQSPSVASARVGHVPTGGVMLHVIPFEALDLHEQARATQKDGRWHIVKLPGNEVGWIRADVVALETIEQPPPPPPPPTPEPEPRYITREELEAALEQFAQDLEARLVRLLAREIRVNEDGLLTAAARAMVKLINERSGVENEDAPLKLAGD